MDNEDKNTKALFEMMKAATTIKVDGENNNLRRSKRIMKQKASSSSSISSEKEEQPCNPYFDDDDDEYWYIKDQYNRISRFYAGYVPEEERGTFGWDEDPVENFEDMRRRIGDPEVLVWMMYSDWEKLQADKHRKA